MATIITPQTSPGADFGKQLTNMFNQQLQANLNMSMQMKSQELMQHMADVQREKEAARNAQALRARGIPEDLAMLYANADKTYGTQMFKEMGQKELRAGSARALANTYGQGNRQPGVGVGASQALEPVDQQFRLEPLQPQAGTPTNIGQQKPQTLSQQFVGNTPGLPINAEDLAAFDTNDQMAIIKGLQDQQNFERDFKQKSESFQEKSRHNLALEANQQERNGNKRNADVFRKVNEDVTKANEASRNSFANINNLIEARELNRNGNIRGSESSWILDKIGLGNYPGLLDKNSATYNADMGTALSIFTQLFPNGTQDEFKYFVENQMPTLATTQEGREHIIDWFLAKHATSMRVADTWNDEMNKYGDRNKEIPYNIDSVLQARATKATKDLYGEIRKNGILGIPELAGYAPLDETKRTQTNQNGLQPIDFIPGENAQPGIQAQAPGATQYIEPKAASNAQYPQSASTEYSPYTGLAYNPNATPEQRTKALNQYMENLGSVPRAIEYSDLSKLAKDEKLSPEETYSKPARVLVQSINELQAMVRGGFIAGDAADYLMRVVGAPEPARQLVHAIPGLTPKRIGKNQMNVLLPKGLREQEGDYWPIFVTTMLATAGADGVKSVDAAAQWAKTTLPGMVAGMGLGKVGRAMGGEGLLGEGLELAGGIAGAYGAGKAMQFAGARKQLDPKVQEAEQMQLGIKTAADEAAYNMAVFNMNAKVQQDTANFRKKSIAQQKQLTSQINQAKKVANKSKVARDKELGTLENDRAKLENALPTREAELQDMQNRNATLYDQADKLQTNQSGNIEPLIDVVIDVNKSMISGGLSTSDKDILSGSLTSILERAQKNNGELSVKDAVELHKDNSGVIHAKPSDYQRPYERPETLRLSPNAVPRMQRINSALENFIIENSTPEYSKAWLEARAGHAEFMKNARQNKKIAKQIDTKLKSVNAKIKTTSAKHDKAISAVESKVTTLMKKRADHVEKSRAEIENYKSGKKTLTKIEQKRAIAEEARKRTETATQPTQKQNNGVDLGGTAKEYGAPITGAIIGAASKGWLGGLSGALIGGTLKNVVNRGMSQRQYLKNIKQNHPDIYAEHMRSTAPKTEHIAKSAALSRIG